MQYSSATAQQVGIDFDHLAAYIGTVSSTTRLSAETIGQSMKTIAARMTAIKNMKTFDDEGENINNVEKALRGVGVSLRDGVNGFRDMQDVLDELAERWDEFSPEDRMFIAQQIGGVRQQNIVLSLLSNHIELQKQLTAQIESTGLAEERYSIYLKGVEAAQNRMTASWEKLATQSVTSEMISGFYDAAASALDFAGTIGGIPTLLKIATVAVVAFNWATVAAFATNPITIWVAAISAAVMAIGYLVNSIETTEEAIARISGEITKSETDIKELRDKYASVDKLMSKYDELIAKEKLTSEETRELIDVQNRLKDLLPELRGGFDKYGNFLLDSTSNVEELTESIVDQIAKLQELKQSQIYEKGKTQADALLDASKAKEYADRGYTYNESIGAGNEMARIITEEQKKKVNDEWSKLIDEARASFSQMSHESKVAFIEQLRANGVGGSEIAKIFAEEMNTELAEQEIALFGNPESLDEKAKESGSEVAEALYEGFSETMKELTDSGSALQGLMGKSEEGKLSFGDIDELAQAYPEYLNALSMENGQLKLNTDAVREYLYVQAQAKVDAAERAGATENEIAILRAYAEQLRSNMYTTLDGVQVTTGAFNQLLWQISNDAEAAGYQFLDAEGKALKSAQSIFQYMSEGNAQFNSVVQQIAQATGRSVQEVMNIVNQMVSQSVANARASIAQIQAMVSSGLSSAIIASVSGGGSYSPAPLLFSSPAPYYGSGSGGGGESKADKKAREEAERLREIERQIANARRDALDDLQDQLKLYKSIIDARKKILDTLADERRYQNDVEDKNKDILKVQNELSALQFDDSESAKARRLYLQDELLRLQGELEDIQYDQSLDQQKEALDATYETFKQQVEAAIRAIQDISAGSLESFIGKLAEILSGLTNPTIPTFHDGGIVGKASATSSASLKPNEVLAKLLNDEGVYTDGQADNFIKNTLPQLAQSISNYGGGDITIEMPISVAGNLDKSVIPNLEKLVKETVKQLNENMLSKGYTRRAETFGG